MISVLVSCFPPCFVQWWVMNSMFPMFPQLLQCVPNVFNPVHLPWALQEPSDSQLSTLLALGGRPFSECMVQFRSVQMTHGVKLRLECHYCEIRCDSSFQWENCLQMKDFHGLSIECAESTPQFHNWLVVSCCFNIYTMLHLAG